MTSIIVLFSALTITDCPFSWYSFFPSLSNRYCNPTLRLKDIYTSVCLARRIESSDVNFVEIPRDTYHAAMTTLRAAVQMPHDTVPAFIQSVRDGNYQPE